MGCSRLKGSTRQCAALHPLLLVCRWRPCLGRTPPARTPAACHKAPHVFSTLSRWTITDTTLSPDQRFLLYSTISPTVHFLSLSNWDVVHSLANVTEVRPPLTFPGMAHQGLRCEGPCPHPFHVLLRACAGGLLRSRLAARRHTHTHNMPSWLCTLDLTLVRGRPHRCMRPWSSAPLLTPRCPPGRALASGAWRGAGTAGSSSQVRGLDCVGASNPRTGQTGPHTGQTAEVLEPTC